VTLATPSVNSSKGPGLAELAAPLDEELLRLRRIDLRAAMDVDLLSRVDTKLVVPVGELLALLRRLCSQPCAPYQLVVTPVGFAPRYSTIYFDTPDLRDYRAHHNGRRVRQKFRYRRYHSTDAVFFEVKQRTNARRTSKTRVAVARIPNSVGPDERSLAADLGLEAHRLIPMLNVTYHRITLVGDGQRVTIDVGLHCSGRNGRSADFGETPIVEIKDHRRRPDSPIAIALRDLGLRPHSVSKYCVGVASCFDGIKSNRFRPTLRRLGARR